MSCNKSHVPVGPISDYLIDSMQAMVILFSPLCLSTVAPCLCSMFSQIGNMKGPWGGGILYPLEF